MKFTTNLVFQNTCEEAFRFYEKALGGKITFILRYKESPMAAELPPESGDLIMHIQMEAGGATLMGGDSPPGCPQTAPMGGFHIHIHAQSPQQAEQLYSTLSDGATNIHMPLTETFWAHRFGVLTDKYGTPWMINCEKAMQPA